MPAAMIFVPSVGGRSHCPEEYSEPRTLAMASATAFDTLLQICKEKQL